MLVKLKLAFTKAPWERYVLYIAPMELLKTMDIFNLLLTFRLSEAINTKTSLYSKTVS